MVLPTSGTATCRVHSTVVLACAAASSDNSGLNAVVLCRCRGEQLQDTFAVSCTDPVALHCANLLTQRSHLPHRLTRSGLLAGLLHLGLGYDNHPTHVGCLVASGQVS